jgi:pilus assembly protein Flp/PilA
MIMNAMDLYRFARSFVTDRKGVTALEYGLIASLIAAAIVTAVGLLGTEISSTFDRVRTGIHGS